MKHFLANSNEDSRYKTDSRFDEALFRDYYSYGFWKGARAGAMSLMTAYNAYNYSTARSAKGDFVRLKEVVAHDGPTITLHSINPSPEYTDFTLNLDDVQRLFNVVKKVPKVRNYGI